MKTRFFTGYDVAAIAVLVANCVFTTWLYPRLPEVVATHFDANGEPNGFMSRFGTAAFGTLFSAAMWTIMRVVPLLAENYGAAAGKTLKLARITAPLACAIAIFTTLVHVALCARALHAGFPVVRAVLFGASAFLLITGLVLPRTSRNAWVGIRNAWTLTSDEVWSRTHRFGGQLFVAASVVSGACALFATTPVATSVFVASVVCAVVAASVYSWWTHRGLSA
jgi:uncharacterized membrane protein